MTDQESGHDNNVHPQLQLLEMEYQDMTAKKRRMEQQEYVSQEKMKQIKKAHEEELHNVEKKLKDEKHEAIEEKNKLIASLQVQLRTSKHCQEKLQHDNNFKDEMMNLKQKKFDAFTNSFKKSTSLALQANQERDALAQKVSQAEKEMAEMKEKIANFESQQQGQQRDDISQQLAKTKEDLNLLIGVHTTTQDNYDELKVHFEDLQRQQDQDDKKRQQEREINIKNLKTLKEDVNYLRSLYQEKATNLENQSKEAERQHEHAKKLLREKIIEIEKINQHLRRQQHEQQKEHEKNISKERKAHEENLSKQRKAHNSTLGDLQADSKMVQVMLKTQYAKIVKHNHELLRNQENLTKAHHDKMTQARKKHNEDLKELQARFSFEVEDAMYDGK